MTSGRAQRLTRTDWLAAAERLLAERGAEALKAEAMARHLNTTKGSFYWHFRDVPAFHAELLARWQEASLRAMAEILAREPAAVPRLRALAQTIADPGSWPDAARIEPAIRAWAGSNAAARHAVAGVDAARLGTLRQLLAEIGIGNSEMARIICAAGIGMTCLTEASAEEARDATGSLVDLVLALR